MNNRVYLKVYILFLLAASSSAFAGDWYEYKSKNFTVYSDISDKKAKKLLFDMERFRTVTLLLTGLMDQPENTRLRIFHFNKSREFRKFSKERNIAGFYTNTLNGPLIFSQENKTNVLDGGEIMFHEYVHHLIRERSTIRHPRWYSEGFAELLATAKIKENSIIIGNFPEWRIQGLQRGPLPTEEILQPDNKKKGYTYWNRYYASSWLLLHYLQFSKEAKEKNYGRKTNEYLLAANEKGGSPELFSEYYEINLQSLNKILKRYLRGRRLSGYEIKTPKKNWEVISRKINKAERLLLFAERAIDLGDEELARKYLYKIKKSEGNSDTINSLKAVLQQHKKEFKSAKSIIQELENEHELSSTIATNIAHYYFDLLENENSSNNWNEEAYTKVLTYADSSITLNPDYLPAYFYKWLAQQRKGLVVDALKTMMKAYQKNPHSIEVNSSIGFYLADQGKLNLARPFLEKTVSWSHNEKIRSEAKKILDLIDKKTNSRKTTNKN